MRRVDRQRRQNWEDIGRELLLQPGALVVVKLRRGQQHDVLCPQPVAQVVPTGLLILQQLFGADRDGGHLLARGHAVLAGGHDAQRDLRLKAGDADHVELVQIVGRDRQEAEAFQQRVVRVSGLVQNPLIEIDPGQLSVDEPLRRARIDLRRISHRRRRGCGMGDRKRSIAVGRGHDIQSASFGNTRFILGFRDARHGCSVKISPTREESRFFKTIGWGCRS